LKRQDKAEQTFKFSETSDSIRLIDNNPGNGAPLPDYVKTGSFY
jgi:hypothetical protein